MAENLPESSHSSPQSADASGSWRSQDASYSEVAYPSTSGSYPQQHEEKDKDSEPHNFIIRRDLSREQVHFQASPIYVHVSEIVDSSDSYGQVILHSYNSSSHDGQDYEQSPTHSSEETEPYKYRPSDKSGHPSSTVQKACGSRSPEPSVGSKSVSPYSHKGNSLSLQSDGVDSQETDSSEQALELVQERIVLNHSSIVGENLAGLSMPIVLDRNNIAAFIATSRSDSALILSNRHRSLNSDESRYLSSSLSSVSLAQTILQQRDLLPTIISSTSSQGTHFPINHKQMLAQKYAAELEAPSTSNTLPANMRTQILHLPVDAIGERVSSPFCVTSSATNLTNSQSPSMYVTHHSAAPSVSMDVYAIDRGAALVSSTRDSPDEIIEHYAPPVHHSASQVHSYVTSSVDLVPSTVDHSLSCNVDSTVGNKLHTQEEIIDSSDRYSDHVDTSEGVLHSTTQGFSEALDDLGSSEDGASSTVTSVLNGVTAVDSADNEHIYHESCELTDLDNLQCCETDSSSTHPDSTRLSLIGRSDLIILPSSSEQVGTIRPRRDLRNKHWCEDCCHFYDKECSRHKIQLIFDKPVLSRAWASLPATYLYVNRVTSKKDDPSAYGVFAKKTIPKRTQFGPIEGVLVKQQELPLDVFLLLVDKEENMFVLLDTEDESISNWMRFVRPAKTYKEQNLVLVQQGQCLYFNTTKAVNPKTELRVWYSSAYAGRWKLDLLELDDDERRAMEDEENAWPCFECNKRFLTSDDLQKHLNQHDEEEPSFCKPISPYIRSKSKRKPQKRNRRKHSKLKKLNMKQEEYQCDICQKTFPRNYSLQRHLIMHSGEKKYKCPICEMKFSHVYNRNRHVRRHRQIGDNDQVMATSIKSLFKRCQGTEWVCIHCQLTFSNSSLLNLHTLTHAAEDVSLADGAFEDDSLNGTLYESGIFKCPQCSNEFSCKRDLIEHAGIHGKVLDKNRQIRGILNPLKPFKCNLCYKSFATNDRLIRHYLVHGSEDSKPLQCSTCYKRFLNNSALACHIKIHSGERKYYECPICKREFDHIVTLKEHVHSHCDSGIYTCPQCLKTFEEYNQIRKHIRAFHSEKRYPCEKCDKIFPRPDKLKLHMLRHSDHREFLCANCGKQFKRKDKLKEHMKRMHAPEREARMKASKPTTSKKFIPKVSPTDYHRFIYKCHSCLLGFKRRGMLVNHLAKRHPDIRPDSVPELNLPILKTTRDYYCQYCEKVYKSSSKRKAHILKNHPGAELPMSNRRKGGIPEIPGIPNPTFSQTVGSITTHPHHCEWCHKQYASKAKLLQHQRKKHTDMMELTLAIAKDHVRRAHVQISATSATSVTGSIVIAHTVPGTIAPDGSVVIDATKRKLQLINRESLTPVVVTSSSENLPSADLLTQAMSELTQTLTEYRAASGEYITARISHSSIHISQSPSTCPSPEQNSNSNAPSAVNTPADDSESENDGTDGALDQSQLTQLLAHYQQPLSPQSLASAVTTTTFSSRSWPVAISSVNNYSSR